MAVSDREKLIASLNEAFKTNAEKQEKERYRMESMQIDNHTVQRMLDIENDSVLSGENSVEQAVIQGCIRMLESEKDYDVKKAARLLSDINAEACHANDQQKQSAVYNFAKEASLKLNMLDKNSPTRAVYLIYICNEINKLQNS
ncbi:MAG: hypothetical protein MJ131_05570 [Lachnospiraceae bacterium]|nr:hypothetical protein [Lachnospiraceae bacterium]